MESMNHDLLFENGVVRGAPYVHHYENGLFYFDIVLLSASLIGNFWMIYYICGQKKARTALNISIVSIAVADILNASVTIPMGLLMFLFRTEDDEVTPFLCKMNKYVGYWSKTVVIYSTLGMVISRYYRITDQRSHVFEVGRCMFYLNLVWFSGAAYNIWKVILNTTRVVTVVPVDVTSNKSTVKWCSTSFYFNELHVISACADFVVIFFLPFVIIISLYVKIIAFQWRNYGSSTLTTSVTSKSRLMICFLYSSMFLGLQLPQDILNTFLLFRTYLSDVTVGNILTCETLSYLQCLFNVLAYCVASTEFQRTSHFTFCCSRISGVAKRKRDPRPSAHGLLQSSKTFDEHTESISLT